MLRVLLIDDDVKIRTVFRLMLEAAGFEVVEAGDGAEGVRLYRKQPTDVVLCDVFMPGRDGLELMRALRSEFPDVKVITMSGGGITGAVDVLPMARLLGAAAVLYKPFDQARVLAAIEKVVAPAVAV